MIGAEGLIRLIDLVEVILLRTLERSVSGVRKFLRSSVPSPCEHFSECLKEGLSNR